MPNGANFAQGMIIDDEGGGGAISFEWNPATVQIDKKIKWNQMHAAGCDIPYIQFGCGEARRLTFELDLSRSSMGDGYVKDQIQKLLKLSKPSVKGSGVDHPPKVTVKMGSALTFKGYVEHVIGHHGLLANPSSLEPYEGRCKIVLIEAESNG